MADAIQNAISGGVGGKHAALWERMRAQKLGRPQMIHRPKVKEEQGEISMQVTMSPETSSEKEEEESLVGVLISDKHTCDYEPKDIKTDTSDEEVPAAFSLGTSFISSSTVENAICESEDTVRLLATPANNKAALKSSRIIMPNGFTPAVLYKNWNTQQQNDEGNEENLKLLQQSMMSSDASNGLDVDTSSNYHDKMMTITTADNDASPILPIESPLCNDDLLLPQSPTSPLTAMRSNTMHQALQETNVYVARIQQLEQELLQAQQQPQGTTTTTTLPLLERNKTLCKEVRFAEQTCVELSQEKAALEQEVQGLVLQLQESREQQQGLHDKVVMSNRTSATLQSEKTFLQNELQQERNQRILLEQQLEQLQHDSTIPTNATTIKENQEPNHNITTTTTNDATFSSRTSRALQTRLEQRHSTESDQTIVELETKLAKSQQVLRDTRHELQLALAKKDSSLDTSHGSSSSSSSNNSAVELELAKAQAKLASVSKELQLMRVAESSARRDFSHAKLEIDRLTRHANNNEMSTKNDASTISELHATVEQLTQECSNHDAAAMEASNTIRALEYELSLSKRQIGVERKRLQAEFVKMTQAAVANMEMESALLNQKVAKRTVQFESRIANLTRTVQHLQESLDFESSETGTTHSSRSYLDDDDERSSNASEGQAKTDEDSQGIVMNATIHQSQSGTRSIHEEMLLEQMEEARLVDTPADTNNVVGHDIFEDLSFIADLSHLYEDLSGLLMHDPASPTRDANAVATPAAAKSTVDASLATKPPIQIRLESVEEDFVRLKTIYERVQSADGNLHLDGTLEEQARVFQNLEQKLGELADEAGKNEAERRQLNVAVLEISKEFNRCQAELKETAVAFEETKKDESNARLEIQRTLVKLEEKECAISVLQDEKERLSLAMQRLSESSNHLLQKQQEEKMHQYTLASATEHIEKLQQKVESKSRQLDESKRQSNDFLSKVETLEANIGKLQVEKSEIEAKYDDASSLLRALSREREQHKQEVVSTKATVSELGRELKLATETLSAQKEKLEKLQMERDNAVDRSSKLSKTVDALATERNELLTEIQQLKTSVATANSELEYLKVSYITCNDQLANVSEKNADKDELVAKFKSSNRAAKEAIVTYEQRLSNLNTELEKTHSERSVLQDQLTSMEKELRATAADFVSYKNGMEEKLSERNDLIDAVQSTAEALKCTYEHKLSSMSTEHETMMDEVNQAANALLREFRGAYADSLGSLSQIGYEFDGGELSSSSRELPWNQSLKAMSSHLPQWKQIVQECTHVIDDFQNRLHEAEEKVGDLANSAAVLKDSGAKMEDKLLLQQHHSDTLADKLTNAEIELAKSMREAAEMSETFASTKRELEHVSKQLANQADLKERTENLIADREEADVRVAEMKRVITSLEERLRAAVGESAHLRRQVQEKDQARHELESQNVSLERKCERLRDYIRKLTAKCEEWSEYAEKQAKRIQQAKSLQREHAQASNARYENTPRPLASSEKVDQSQWSVERRMLDRVANLAGEEDLDALASELQHFGLK